MDRKAFRQLLKRYLDNSCTDEERRVVEQWYELLDRGNPELSDLEINEVEDRLWNKIQSGTVHTDSDGSMKTRKIVWWKYAAAASVVAAVLTVSVIGFQNKKKKTSIKT